MTSSFYDDGTLMNRVLQPYLEAVSNVSSSNDTTSVVRAVIHKLLQDSNLFVGYNIMKQHLLTTSMKTGKTGNTIDSKLLNTLDLFSYGTISDYITDTQHDTYMTLTEAQLTKLRQLTALSVIIDYHHQGIISYHDIHAAAFMNSNTNNSSTISSTTATTATIRETESLLSPLIASKMIVGKLSQKKMSFILGMSHGKNNQSGTTDTSSSGNNNMDTGTAIPTDSTFSKSLLVLQSRDINVHDEESTNIVPKLISSIQRMRTQINDAHQHLIQISQPEQQSSSSSSSSSLLPSSQPSQQTASTMMTTTMPMEVERIRLSTTTATTSAKRSRSSDGSSQNI